LGEKGGSVLQPTETNRSAPPVQELTAPKKTVLVVDDEEIIRNLIARLLSDAGYQVLTAGDGFQALEMLVERIGSVDLVLTDLTMPRMSGEELAQCAGRLSPAPRFLFVSGFFATVADSRLPGPVLAKPFSRADLLALVGEL
jgi:CheY-like chemotaxis protein